MECSPPGSSVHGISQAKILEWVATSSSRGIFLTQGSNPCLFCLRIGMRILYHWPTKEAQTNSHCTLMKLESSWRKALLVLIQKLNIKSNTVFALLNISYSYIHVLVLMASWRKLCRKRKVLFPSERQTRYFAFWVSSDVLRPAPAPATIPIKVLILHVARTLMWIMEGGTIQSITPNMLKPYVNEYTFLN